MKVLAENGMLPILVLVIVVVTFAVIALVAFIIYRMLHPKLKEENKVDDKQAAKESLDRILVDVEDKETAEQIANYHEEDDNEQ